MKFNSGVERSHTTGVRHLLPRPASKSGRRSKYRRPIGSNVTKHPLYISVHPDGSDLWRLKPIIDLLKEGGVGIIPTDSVPAVVCDINNNEAIQRLYLAKNMNPKKPLSLLCRGFSDIGAYTTGFPVSNEPGVPGTFTIAKQILPGPYTLILHASKKLPKQMIDFDTARLRQRKFVGIRWPDDPICQYLLDAVEGPMIASSMHLDHGDDENFEWTTGVELMDTYSDSGIDFVVSVGERVVHETTIIDMTERVPKITREGSTDLSWVKEALSL